MSELIVILVGTVLVNNFVLVRFLGLTDIDSSISFTDTGSSIFEQDILKLATAGITRGCNADGTEFCPDDSVTRGQMAAFLVR